jgi:LuxR family transcriptional regulator, maltose regulon positive regulatory protein
LQLWRSPELHTLQVWLTALPEAFLDARPRLNLYYAWVLVLTNHMGGAEQRLQRAEKSLTTTPPHDESFVWGMLYAIRSSLTGLRRQFAEATRDAHQALDLLPEEAISWRCMAAISLGVSDAAMSNLAAATEMLTYAMDLSQEIGSSFAMLSAFWHLASLQINQLRLSGAEQTCNHLLRLLQEPDLSRFPVEGHIALLRGEIALEHNELERAEHYLGESAKQINPEGFPMGVLRAYVALTRVRHIQKDSEGAAEYLAKANVLVHSHHLQARSFPLTLYRARMWLEQGNLSPLSQWVIEQALAVDDEITPHREPSYLHLARYLLLSARSTPDDLALTQALALLSRMVQQAEASERPGSLIRALALYALAQAQANQQHVALETLARALVLAEPERAMRVFADEGIVMARLLSQLLEVHRQGALPASLPISIPYIRSLLAVMEYRQDAPVYQPANIALPEPLSERELEVLRLLADDLSSNEIAERLIIAVETARKHVKNIYGKLAVHSRSEAIRRSREIGLL